MLWPCLGFVTAPVGVGHLRLPLELTAIREPRLAICYLCAY